MKLGGDQLQAYRELQCVVSTCPNLKGLAISSAESVGDQFHNLRLRSSGLRALEFDQSLGQDTERSDDLDCSALERFSVTSLSFFHFRNAGARLRGLRSLRVENGGSYDWLLPTFNIFLHSCPALEDLDLTGFTDQFEEGLFKHLGKTLITLRLHEHEVPSGLCQRRVLSDAEIRDLGRYCPKLRRLGLDIAYSGSWVSPSYPIIETI